MRGGWSGLLWLPLMAGCALGRSAPVLPDNASVVRGQLMVYSDFELPSRHRLLDELIGLRGDMGSKLDLPMSDEPIHVYLFDRPAAYRAYITRHHPEFPDRRAFFLESDTRLCVYAHWGDRVGEDLRHEVAHGYLHSVTPNVPLWLDEGLAEYFETPRGHGGFHGSHRDLLWQRYQQNKWTPDLPRLETFQDVATMTQLDYAEAWLWIHFLLETTPDRLALLQDHLAGLRRTAIAPPLSQLLGSLTTQPERQLLDHLESLARQP